MNTENAQNQKHLPRKRIKAAHRKYIKVRPTVAPISLKAYARGSECNIPDDAKAWFQGKKTATLCQQRVRVNVKKNKKNK